MANIHVAPHIGQTDQSVENLTAFTIVNNAAEAVAARPDPALWLMTTDRLAPQTLQALHRFGIGISQEAALVSLENNTAFFHHNISACAPDFNRIGYLMAHALLGDIPLNKSLRNFIRFEVPIIHRQTTPV
jgi:DNA-binding LacI/PurR family transcriptional regulator